MEQTLKSLKAAPKALVNRAKQFDRLALASGLKIRSCTDISKLSSMNEAQAISFARILESWISVLSIDVEHTPGKSTLAGDKWLFEAVAKALGYDFDPEFKNKFEDGDIIEWYTTDLLQEFRNRKFSDMCSYDLRDLATIPYPMLFSRPERVEDQLKAEIGKTFSGDGGTRKFECDQHILQETLLGNNKRFQITPKWISPIHRDGKVAAVAFTITAKEISPRLI